MVVLNASSISGLRVQLAKIALVKVWDWVSKHN